MFPDCLVPHTKRFLMSSLCVYIKFTCIYKHTRASQVAVLVKNPPARAGDMRDLGLIPGSGTSPGRENGTPPGESNGGL